MDCEKIRDQFSLLLEGELKPPEEERVQEHLASCPACEKEWNEFERLIDWLHSAGEEEVPDGLLSEIRERLDERKEKAKRERVPFLRSMKIPLQAMAMVTILFIAFYLTRMPPFEALQKRETEKPGTVFFEIEKKEVEKTVSPAPSVAERKVTLEPPRATERPKGKAVLPHPEKLEGEGGKMGEIMTSLAKQSALEMTLKITNREIAMERLRELVKGLGGEVALEEENVLLTSLPASSFRDFEKGVIRIGSSFEDQGVAARAEKKDAFRYAPGAKMRAGEKKEETPSSPVGAREDRVLIRIRLTHE